jgi:methyl-accepting chemotaxis protein
MTDLHDTISGHLGRFESLLMKIPGYGGYKEKEMRREADTLLREHLARQLVEQLTKAKDVTSQMITGPGIAQLDDMGKANTRLQTLIDKVRTAAQGYAGFFDAVKVKEEELDLLYEFDERMIGQVDQISGSIDQVQAALDGGDTAQVAPAVRQYTKTVTEASALFDQRRDNMLGLS